MPTTTHKGSSHAPAPHADSDSKALASGEIENSAADEAQLIRAFELAVGRKVAEPAP
ncbi:MAG TPA: hypothetical protein VI197_18495 [Polyangiaceae bacterium]